MRGFFQDQLILVTGASSGIGLACAFELNTRGACIVACGLKREKLEKAQDSCAFKQNWHNEPLGLQSSLDQIPAWIASLRFDYGKFYELLNAAGIGDIASVSGLGKKQVQKHFEINFLRHSCLRVALPTGVIAKKCGAHAIYSFNLGRFSRKGSYPVWSFKGHAYCVCQGYESWAVQAVASV